MKDRHMEVPGILDADTREWNHKFVVDQRFPSAMGGDDSTYLQ
jgi:hypothetical protein